MTAGHKRMFKFEYFNGNCGKEEYFEDLKDALTEADYKFSHLTKKEKEAYNEPGNYFLVSPEICHEWEILPAVWDFVENGEISRDDLEMILKEWM